MQDVADAAAGSTPEVTVRLVRPGEGAAVVSVAEAAREAGGWAPVRSLQRVLDRVGGQIALPELDGATGWCFAAFRGAALVGMVYACTPVRFLQQCPPAARAALTPALVEFEIVAVDEHAQGQGVGTVLLQRAEQHVRAAGVQLLTAKIRADDTRVLRWWRHRGWSLSPAGEPAFLDRAGQLGIEAGQGWRLAVRALDREIPRRGVRGLWATPPLLPSKRA